MAENQAKIKIQYYRSFIQAPVKHKKVVKGLGFTRLNQVVEREENCRQYCDFSERVGCHLRDSSLSHGQCV